MRSEDQFMGESPLLMWSRFEDMSAGWHAIKLIEASITSGLGALSEGQDVYLERIIRSVRCSIL